MSVENGDGFDGWLERQLEQHAAKSSGPTPSPAQAQYHAAYLQGGLHMSVLAKAAALVSTKGAVGLAVAFLAVGAAGAATEIAATGSPNPSVWGANVVSTVRACKADLQPGQHGIGQCVSEVAKTHGKEVSSSHSSNARLHASDERNAHDDHTPGAPNNTGKPTDQPGKPSNVPPTSHP